MHVLFLTHSFPRFAGDAAGSFVLRLATALGHEGVEVHVVAPAAADHARRYLVMTFPVDRWWTRAGLSIANVLLRLRSNGFRAYVHSTRAVLATAQRHGMRPVEHRRGFIWQLIALER